MNRKNTILLAVLVNAGLLVVLFVTALTSQEEISIPPTHEVASAPVLRGDNSPPLFGDEIDLALRQPTTRQPASPLPQVLPETTAASKTSESLVAHSLPPLATTEEVNPEAVAAAPVRPESSLPEVMVKKGDTLEKIAKANHTTVDEIIKVNQLPSSFLRVGQKLRLPGEKVAAIKSAKSAKPIDNGPDYYTVKVGDNAWTIAMKNHLKVDELLKLNGLNEEKARKLKPGDRLRIR
ncbi:MAG: LysM peptidoglycan-binding domain-containing protein [Verrucomicrobiota bacterium]|nr:LysM peptidoglycan-binding domain-containing protein [Verrucomicrobiota bacterium]